MGTTAQKLTYLNDTKGLIKQSINNLGGNITSQTTFRNYATQLENIYQNLPKVNGTGTSLSLSPTIKGRLSSTPKGDTYQYTTTGKNLLPLNNIQETTTNGVTYSCSNGVIKLSGTAINSVLIDFDSFYLPAGTYNLNTNRNGTVTGSWQTYLRNSSGNIIQGSNAFTTTEGQMVYFRIYINSGVAYSGIYEMKPQLETGSSATSYEPYTGGIASPNPSYPQTIQSVTGNQVVSVDTKNLLEITENNLLVHCTYVSGVNTNEYKLLCTQSDMYVNEVSNVGVSYNAIRNGNLIDCVYGETIYFDTGNNLFNKNFFTEFDENLVSLGSYSKTMASGTYTPTNQNCKYITLRFGYGANATPGTTYTLAPIISKTSDTNYVPYQNQTQTIRLGNLKVYDEDYITGTPDNWSIVRNNGEVVLDGTETFEKDGVRYRTYIAGSNPNRTRSNCLSDYFHYISSGNTNGGCFIYEERAYFILEQTTATVSEFTTWLSTHNTTVVYPLATPTTETITDTDLIEDLNNLYYAQSNDDTTNISVSGNLPMILSVSALKGE